MEKIAERRIALATLGWSVLGAAAVIGASLANKNWGTPDATNWIIALWWAGFAIAVALGLRHEK